jgi:hypothetical protein
MNLYMSIVGWISSSLSLFLLCSFFGLYLLGLYCAHNLFHLSQKIVIPIIAFLQASYCFFYYYLLVIFLVSQRASSALCTRNNCWQGQELCFGWWGRELQQKELEQFKSWGKIKMGKNYLQRERTVHRKGKWTIACK